MEYSRSKSGLRFDVSTDLEPMEKNLFELKSTRDVQQEYLKHAYRDPNASWSTPKLKDLDIESSSLDKSKQPTKIIPVSSFAQMAIRSFGLHYPMKIRPDDIWSCIVFAVNAHVLENPQVLKKSLVHHNGRRELLVKKHEYTLKGQSPEEWESQVFKNFKEQIDLSLGKGFVSILTAPYSTTTSTDAAISNVALMSTTSPYFTYTVQTLCGIPWVKLLGSKKDWVELRKRAEELRPFLSSSFADKWLPCLLPVLDEFVNAFEGASSVNQEFWQRMVKIVYGKDSGEHHTISGWLNVLFPYLAKRKPNVWIMPWDKYSPEKGPTSEQFPKQMSDAPLNWQFKTRTLKLRLHGGILGYVHDEQDGDAVVACHSWVLSHDPIQ